MGVLATTEQAVNGSPYSGAPSVILVHFSLLTCTCLSIRSLLRLSIFWYLVNGAFLIEPILFVFVIGSPGPPKDPRLKLGRCSYVVWMLLSLSYLGTLLYVGLIRFVFYSHLNFY